jgi:hypothetical protein
MPPPPEERVDASSVCSCTPASVPRRRCRADLRVERKRNDAEPRAVNGVALATRKEPLRSRLGVDGCEEMRLIIGRSSCEGSGSAGSLSEALGIESTPEVGTARLLELRIRPGPRSSVAGMGTCELLSTFCSDRIDLQTNEMSHPRCCLWA